MTRFTISLLAGVAVLGFASTAFAADLIVDEPAMPAMAAASGNWDGAYIGAFAGYGWGTLTDDEGGFSPPETEFDLSGWTAGVTVGADFTISEAIVAGIVADVAWSDIGADGGDYGFDGSNINWQGSVRGRLGIDAGSFLPYVTAGLAFANNTVSTTFPSEDTQTHIGWTVGAGVEFAVADNVSLDLQYRYSDFGTKEYDAPFPTDISLTSHAITAGINFRF